MQLEKYYLRLYDSTEHIETKANCGETTFKGLW